MALDKLVDSAQLDADLGDIADAIRAKGGTSAELSFPQGFVDAVGAIETGADPTVANFVVGLNPSAGEYILQGIKTINIVRKGKDVAYKGGRVCSNCLSLSEVLETINVDYGIVQPTNGTDAFRSDRCEHLQTININIDTSEITGWDRFFYSKNTNNAHGIVVTGTPIDFNKMTRWSDTLELYGLSEVRFVPNRIKATTVTISANANAEYSNDTWASLINALSDTVAGTLTIGSAAQGVITGIIGRNNDGLFVIDADGDTNLMVFATTVKGWTVA